MSSTCILQFTREWIENLKDVPLVSFVIVFHFQKHKESMELESIRAQLRKQIQEQTAKSRGGSPLVSPDPQLDTILIT